MRGKDLNPAFCGILCRITPAHAGKRPYVAIRISSIKDHPRTCGEKSAILEVISEKKGSPPHMRGKGGKSKRKSPAARITPAHAGKRYSPRLWRGQHADHPRTCGEKFVLLQYLVHAEGSPPHMRGKVNND